MQNKCKVSNKHVILPERTLVNKGQNMLHKLSLDANSLAISYWQE